MILTFALIGIALSSILIFFNASKFSSSVYLGIFFLGISFYVLNQYVLLYSQSVTAVSIILLFIPVSGILIYLSGPMLYWYVRSSLTDNYRLKKSDLWHLLPAVIFFLAAFPDLFNPWSVKVNAATAIVNDYRAMELYKPTLLSHFLSYPFMFISRPVLISCYACWSAILFIRFVIRKRRLQILAEQHFMIKWLWVFLSTILILVLSHMLLTIELTVAGSRVFFTLTTLKALSLAALSVLLLSPFFFPEVLYGLPRIPRPSKTPKSPVSDLSKNHPEKTKTEIHFEDDYFIQIQRRAEICMQEFQPYLQPDFNLAQLSVLMHVPVHHLAYYFREVKKQTFSDFRNKWRVEHAKNLMNEGKSANLTLEAIGILSGFSSRNTFLNAFKRAEGISPHVFLTQIKEK